MRPKTTVAIVLLFFLNAFSASFATIPVQNDVDLFFPEASETSARNSSCGTNSTLTDLSISMDASSYTQGSSAIATFYINCSVNGDYYDLYVSISGPSVQSYPGWNWTESNAYESFNSTIYTLTAGTFCVNASLYATPSGGNFHLVDTESHCFTVSSTSGGGGGSSTYVPNGSLAINGVSSSYSNASNVTAYFAHTNLDVGVTYGEMWHLTDTNGNVVQGYGVNQTWNATSSNYTSSSVLAGLSAGFYCITATLYTVYSNGTATILSTTTTCFTIAASTPTTSCGTNSTLTDLMIWMDASSYTQGDSATATYYINCTVVNGFYVLDVWTYGPSYQVYNGWNWTAYSAYESMNTTVSNLTSGTYCTNATLYYYPSSGGYQTADSESHCFTVSSTSSGGGGSSTYVPNGSLAIYGVSSNYSSGSNVTAFFDYTNLDVGVTYGEMWHLTDANGNVVQGYGVNQTWNATWSNTNSTAFFGNLSNGTYCITATLYTVYSNGTAVILDTNTTCFTIGSTTQTTGCGYDWNLASIIVSPNDYAFIPGEDHNATIYSSCSLFNENMVLRYNVTDTSSGQTLSYGSWQWVPISSSDFHYFENLNLAAGVYHVQVGLYHYDGAATYTLLDDTKYNFTVAQTPTVNETLDINLNGLNYSTGQSIVATMNATNLQLWSNYTIIWSLLDDNAFTVDSGNMTIDSFSSNDVTSQLLLTAGSNGTYCLDAELYDVNWNMVAQDDTCFNVGWNPPNNGGGNNNNSTGVGSSPSNPLMPVVNCSNIDWSMTTNISINDCLNNTNAFWFEFNQSGSIVWIDPVVAVGYDFVVYNGPAMTSVQIPTGYGDDVFDLYLYNGNGWYDTNIDINAGVTYTFQSPVERMSIRGIEAYEMLDPNDPTAFVAGITFANSGTVLMTMTPVTENYTMQGCGYDPAYTDLMIWTDYQTYQQGATTYADYYVNCSVNTKDYELHVFVYSTSGSSWSDYDVWNWTETDGYESIDDDWTNLAPDTYCINATLYMVSGGAYQFVDFEVTCFTVTGNNNGGGSGTPDPCGLNSSYTLIMSWSDAQTYNYGDNQNISFYVNCTRTGEAYTLEYYVYDITNTANYVASGSYSWTASGVWHSWSDDVYGLNPGDYCVLTNLYQAGNYLTDDGGINCFTVVGTTANTPPTLVATQQALIAYAGDPLDCYANGMVFNDPDNDPDNSNIEWYVNGNSVASGVQTILPAGSVSLGDTLYCEATAHDGITSGNTLQRHYYVVPSNNTAPTVSAITISPTSPEESDPLTCSYTYNDPENDPDASIVVWSINGVATTTQGTTLSSGYVAGDFVTCSVTAFDGSSLGNTGTGTVLVFSSGSSGGGSTPTIGVLGTLAVLCVAFVLVSRKEFEE